MVAKVEFHDLVQPCPVLFCLLLLFSIIHLFKLSRSRKLNLPPCPPKLPIIGNLHQIGKLPHRSFETLSEKYGPIVLLYMGQNPTLLVSSANLAREILLTQDAFIDRPQTRAADVFFHGCCDVAFCPYGEYWRQAKKICVLELLTQKRVKTFQLLWEEELSEMNEKVRKESYSGSAIDLSEMFQTISNNIVSRSVLGRVYEREDGNKSFGELSRRVMELLGAFCFEDLFPSLGWMDVLTGLTAKLRRTSNEIHAFLDRVIEEHQALIIDHHHHDKSDEKEFFIDTLLHLQKDGMLGIGLTRENIKAIILDMFVEGTDTTVALTEWTMAELVKNPRIMKKAQEEVRRVVGQKSRVTSADIDQMHYLKCVVKETLRLHPPLILNRQTTRGTKLAGYDIPAKTMVAINVWAIQRNPKLWEKPEEFIPERFENGLLDFKGQQKQYIPFGAGRRNCPGTLFAVAGAESVIANLLNWFDWKLPADSGSLEDLDMNEVFALVIRKRLPLHLVPILHSY